jgi:hypothetical protein
MNTLSAIILGVVVLVFVAAVMSLPVMLLWDWLMPTIFGLPEITWFQAWGLLFLCGMLFKNNTVKKD